MPEPSTTEPTPVLDTISLIAALHVRRVTYQKISEEVGVHWMTVHRWAYGQSSPRPAGPINRILEAMLDEIGETGE